MAVFEMPRQPYTGAPRRGGFSAIVGAIVAWNDARVTRKALSALTDRELNDLGLLRGDIEEITRR